MNLKRDLELIMNGFSCETPVSIRAERMLKSARTGNHKRAEKLASEILTLQAAEKKRFGIPPSSGRPDLWEWQLTAEVWAIRLFRACNATRNFWVDHGATEAEALAEAHRVKFTNRLTHADIEPVHPVIAVAAE